MAGYYEKTPSGKYRLFASAGTGPGKKRQRFTKTVEASSDRQASRLLAQFVAEVEKGEILEPSKFTFEDFTKKWLSDYGEKNLAPKTLHRYKRILETRIIPALGHLKLEKVRPIHLLEFYRNLEEDGIREDGRPGGLSGKTILQHHRIISSILTDAVQWQFIPANPASRVKPPKVQKRQMPCYDENQISQLLESIGREDFKHQILVHLALWTGLRRGEIMGLEWADLDFEKGTLEVRRVSQYVPGQGIFTKSPKNETSERLLALPPFLVDMLQAYRKKQVKDRLQVGELWQGSDRLFTTWDGRPGHPEWPSQWFSKFVKKHNLPPLNFHGLRHTSATMLINQGLPAKNISGRLGHSNISTTMDLYGHYLKSADEEAAERLDMLYNEKFQHMTK